MEDLISVIINVYNGEKFIGKCLDCIINQTYKNLDILVINDGSTDGTLEVCESYKDERIRIINQENMGLALSRNVGIDNAIGEFIYFVDVDDWVENDVIEHLYSLCKKYNTKMSSCKCLDVYDYDSVIINHKEKVDVISSEEMLKKILLGVDRAVTLWNKLYKKEIFDGIRFEKRPINDVTVTYKLAIAAEKIAYSNQIKYYYLRHRNAITSKEKNNTVRSIDHYNAAIERYNYINKIFPGFKENNIGLIRVLVMLYLSGDEKLVEFLDSQDAYELLKSHFSISILISSVKFKEKMKIVLFTINRKLGMYVYSHYKSINNKYKM